MASSLRHLISDKAAAAAAAAASSLLHRRITLPQIRRCSTKLAPPRRASSPWLMLQSALTESSDDDDDDMLLQPALKVSSGAAMDHFNFYSLAENKVFSFKKPSDHSPRDLLVGSSHGWLALHNITTGDSGLSLLNPITGDKIKLPPITRRVDKLILSCDPRDQACRSVASLDGGGLAFCWPGRRSEWTVVHSSIPSSDLAYLTAEGLFLCIKNTEIGNRGVDESEELQAWDATDPYSPKTSKIDNLYTYRYPLPRPETPWHCNTGSYLVYVEDANKLLQVRRYVCDKYHNTFSFDVYAVDRERRELIAMDVSLDGLALFLGPNHSLAVRAAAFPGLKAGSVYYTGSLLAVTWPRRILHFDFYGYGDAGVFDPDNMYGGNDVGVFDCSNKTIYNCYYMHDQYWDVHKIWPPPLWFTPSPLSSIYD